MENNKIVLGNVGLTNEEHEGKHGKIRITTMIDLEVADALKSRALEMGLGYQTLLNKILHKALFEGPKTLDLEARVSAVENLLIESGVARARRPKPISKEPRTQAERGIHYLAGKTAGRSPRLARRTKKTASR